MLKWSIKTLLSEPMRVFISALAVAVSFILVIFFSAVFEGESDQMVAYLEKVDADVWVMQKGVSNMHMSSSMVWDWKLDRLAQLPDVVDVAAILYLNGPVKAGGKDWFSYIIGISEEHARVGPWSVSQGKAIPQKGEAVIPQVISQLTGIQLGDKVTLADQSLTVVGLTKGSFSMASSLIFVSREDLADLLQAGDQYSYIMVYAAPGIEPANLADEISQEIDKVNALTSEDFIRSDWQLAVQMGAEIIKMMTVIGMILATLIVAFTAYSLTSRKRKELAIAKALGFRKGQIYMAALCQSTVITLFGLALAVIISFSVLTWIPTMLPQINLSIRWHQFVPLALISIPVAIIASIVAARTVANVDPVTVFNR